MSRVDSTVPRSLVWATDIDVLPLDRVVERRSGFLLIRSPGNPAHYWGNLLLFDREPRAGDALRWEASFDEAFGDEPLVRHRTFAWDLTDGTSGAADDEFSSRGYDIEESIGLVARADQLVRHPRENREVAVQALDPLIGADEALWDAVVELQVPTAKKGTTRTSTARSPARGLRIGGRCSGPGGARGSLRSNPTAARSSRAAAWS